MRATTPRTVAALGGGVVALVTLSGCASASSGGGAVDVSELPTVIVGAAQLDVEHEDVMMPLGGFQLTADEAALMRNASDVLMQQCLDRAGVDVDYPQGQHVQYLSVTHFSFGVWTDARASLYGYGLPPHPAAVGAFEDDLANGDPARLSAVRGCTDEPETVRFNDGNDGMEVNVLASRADSASWSQMEADPRSASIFEAHRACMADKGFQVGDDWAVEGIESMSAEQKIATALIDVGCKRDSDFVQGLADIAAAYQQTYIANNRGSLEAEKHELDEILVRAKAILGSRPIGVPPVG